MNNFLKEIIKKLEANKRRDLNIIALYFEERRPDLRNNAQVQVALKRHIRSASQLKPFTDDQILEAVRKAKRLTSEWTLETCVKILTK